MKSNKKVSFSNHARLLMTEILALSLLLEQDQSDYQMKEKLDSKSKGMFPSKQIDLFILLYGLQQKKYVSMKKFRNEKQAVRHYFHIEPAGVAYLNEIKQDYFSMHNAMTTVLESIMPQTKEDPAQNT